MEFVTPILIALNNTDRDILFFIVAVGALALAAFCMYVILRHSDQK
jgi:hypothetical protein